MRVLLIAEHASAQFGGEAALALHYFRVLRARNHDVWLLVHARTREELSSLFNNDPRIIFISDAWSVRALWRFGQLLSPRVASWTTGYLMRFITQRRQVSEARRLIASYRIDVVHQPMPVSPREPSLLYRLGAPVVIGPLNGGMNFPPSFDGRQSRFEKIFVTMARRLVNMMNMIFPGKQLASVVVVANERTREALPKNIKGCIVELVENGVDLSVWKRPSFELDNMSDVVRFVFVGRLVDWKGVDLLLRAFKKASAQHPMSLSILGDGPERPKLEAQASELGLMFGGPVNGTVTFFGWLSQSECARKVAEQDVLILPSLYECGGAVILEAMALGRPIIAADWGGPKDYVDPSCGILVYPNTPDEFVNGLADAMLKLSRAPDLRRQMGVAAIEKVRQKFDWERKVDIILEIYHKARQCEQA